jgi:hypothetical protein
MHAVLRIVGLTDAGFEYRTSAVTGDQARTRQGLQSRHSTDVAEMLLGAACH